MKKLTYNFVKKQIEKEGYSLLSKEYISVHSKLKVQCPSNHIYFVEYNSFKHGRRCPICFGTHKHSYEFIKKQIENVKGYKLLSKEYINANSKIKVQCDKGHKYEVIYNSFRLGYRCSVCGGTQKLTYNFVKKQIENVKGYKLLSKEYKNSKTKLKLQCDREHIYKVKYNEFNQGKRCPICWNERLISKVEKEILEIVNNTLPNDKIIANDRTQILNPLTNKNLELDIYMPELNKAIEFNGEYWHSLKYQIIKDKIKVEQCKEKNINLLVIQEQDWIDNKEKQIKKIKKFLL